MSTQTPQESVPDSQILDVGGSHPFIRLYIGNMRFGRNHQEHNIEAISYQINKRIAEYEEKREQPGNEALYPELILTGQITNEGPTYNFQPGVEGGLEDSLEHLFETHSSDDLADQVENYLEILAFWNMHAFRQKSEWRGLRGESASYARRGSWPGGNGGYNARLTGAARKDATKARLGVDEMVVAGSREEAGWGKRRESSAGAKMVRRFLGKR